MNQLQNIQASSIRCVIAHRRACSRARYIDVSADQGLVTVNGIIASVSNRSYLAENVPLQAGVNTINIAASDAVGNTETKTIQVTYQPLTGAKVVVASGQSQEATIGTALSQPLLVTLLNADNTPAANKVAVFRVIQGDGSVQEGAGPQERALVATSNAAGQASVNFTLGTRAGEGNHRVSVRAVGFENEAVFYASAKPNPGNKVSVIAGNNQRGGYLSPVPAPFIVAVTDLGGNVWLRIAPAFPAFPPSLAIIDGAQVTFEVIEGDGKLQNDQITYTTTTDSDGRATAHLTLGPKLGLDTQRVVARLIGTEAIAGFTASALMPGDPGQTKITGVVLDNQDKPIPGATLRIQGTTRQAQADAQGQFTITQVPVGPVRLLADGSTTTRSGEWPTLSFDIVTVAGADNPLHAPIYLVPLNMTSAVTVGNQDVRLTLPEVPGFALDVKAGSVTFPDGSKTGRLSVTVVNNDKVPMSPPNGMQPQFIVTIQPVGAKFDPPATLTLPNVDGYKPGAEVEMFSYDHDLEEFVTIGWGTVSNDGATIKSNPGVGVVKAGWHCGAAPSGSGSAAKCGECRTCNGTTCENDDNASPYLPRHVPNDCRDAICKAGKADYKPNDSDKPDPKASPDNVCKTCNNGSIVSDSAQEQKQCPDEGDPSCSVDKCKKGICSHAVVTPLTPYSGSDPHLPDPDYDGLTSGTRNALVCLNRLTWDAGGKLRVTSAYRPQGYQDHLREVWDKYKALEGWTEDECVEIASDLDVEWGRHKLIRQPVKSSDHTRGNGFDARWALPADVNIDDLARQCGLVRPEPVTDEVHFRF